MLLLDIIYHSGFCYASLFHVKMLSKFVKIQKCKQFKQLNLPSTYNFDVSYNSKCANEKWKTTWYGEYKSINSNVFLIYNNKQENRILEHTSDI